MPQPVTLDTFIRGEPDMYLGRALKNGAAGPVPPPARAHAYRQAQRQWR